MPTAPHILVLMTDDHGQWASSPYGATDLHTPSMQFLADEGARLDRAFTPCPVCSPARACFWTNRFPSGHGVHDWIQERGEGGEHPGIGHLPHLAQRLQAVGYHTGACGKWHCHRPWVKPTGFDHWFISDGTNARYGKQPYCDGQTVHQLHGHQPPLTTAAALRFLQQRPSDRPFFLYVGYTDTHSPFSGKARRLENWYRQRELHSAPLEPMAACHGEPKMPAPEGEERRDRLAAYAAGVSIIDEHLGRLLDELDSQQLLDQTLVIYTADHGHNNGHHGLWLKGNGTTPQNFLEESILVPSLLRWPGRIAPGRGHDFLADHCDLHATLLDAAGAMPSEGVSPREVGRSYLSLLGAASNAEAARRFKAFQCGEYANARMIRTPTAKLIRRYPGPNGHFRDEFYDLTADPRETCNVITEAGHADTIAHLDQQMQAFFAQVEDERPGSVGLDFAHLPRHNPDEPWRRPLAPEAQALLR